MKEAKKGSFSPLLHLTYVLQQLSDDQLLAKAGVGLSQTRIMSVLNDSVPRSQRAIAQLLQQTEANVSRQLKIMHSSGLVSVTKTKKDARRRDVKLTSKGKQKYQQAIRVLANQENKLFKLMDKKDLKSLNKATDNLLVALNIDTSGKHRQLG